MRFGAILLLAAAGSACAPQALAPHVPLRLISDAKECFLGQPFNLSVQRDWRSGTEPVAWDPTSLQPLLLELESEEVRVNGEWMHETRRFRALALAVGDLSFPPDLHLTVRSGLRPEDSDLMEAPAAATSESGVLWMGLILLTIAGLASLLLLRRRPVAPLAVDDRPDFAARLRQLDPEARNLSDQLAAILRDWLADRTGIHAPGRHAEELLTAEPRLSPALMARVRKIVIHCQEARFAGCVWSPEQARNSLSEVVAVVEEAS